MLSTRPSAELSVHQRRSEITHILAVGVFRLRKQRLLSGGPDVPNFRIATNSSAGGLEVSGKTVLSVHTG